MSIFQMFVLSIPTLVVVGLIVCAIEESPPFIRISQKDGRGGVMGYGIFFLAFLDFIFVSFWAIIGSYNFL